MPTYYTNSNVLFLCAQNNDVNSQQRDQSSGERATKKAQGKSSNLIRLIRYHDIYFEPGYSGFGYTAVQKAWMYYNTSLIEALGTVNLKDIMWQPSLSCSLSSIAMINTCCIHSHEGIIVCE